MSFARQSDLVRVSDLWSEVDGLRVYAATAGAGPPVVLVHGYGVSGRYMLPLARELSACFSVFVPDLPGHGQSQRSNIAPGVEAHANTLAGWLKVVGLRQPAIVANSFGCQIVTKLVVQHPGRVGPMILVGPTVDPGRRGASRQMFAALRDTAREPLRLVALAAHDGARQRVGPLVAAARSVLADRIEDRLPLIEQPTVVLVGEEDAFVSRGWAREAAGLLPRGRLVVVRGEPHAVHYTRPALVRGIVAEFLSEEAEYASGELTWRLPHGDVAAGKANETGDRKKPLPLLGHPHGYEPVPLAPHE
jgi:pimeloyl-ACP methyl ester carboxylesterase